jgi:hypothetical protein
LDANQPPHIQAHHSRHAPDLALAPFPKHHLQPNTLSQDALGRRLHLRSLFHDAPRGGRRLLAIHLYAALQARQIVSAWPMID